MQQVKTSAYGTLFWTYLTRALLRRTFWLLRNLVQHFRQRASTVKGALHYKPTTCVGKKRERANFTVAYAGSIGIEHVQHRITMNPGIATPAQLKQKLKGCVTSH